MIHCLFLAVQLLISCHVLADTIVFYNGQIYTMNEYASSATAMCIDQDTERFIAVGNLTVVTSACPQPSQKINLANSFVLPGLIDSHAHLVSEGERLAIADLTPAKGIEDILSILQKFIQEHNLSVKDWVIGFGWDQNAWTDWNRTDFPTRYDLDSKFPDHALVLSRIDGHSDWVNSATLKRVPSIPKTDPQGGHVVRDSNGNPTGIFVDKAREFIRNYIPAPSKKTRIEYITSATDECLSYGVTGLHDMGQDKENIKLYKEMVDNGTFPLRVHALRLGLDEGDLGKGSLPTDPKYHLYKNHLTTRAVKFFLDGALGSWGAAMIKNYSDHPNAHGALRMTQAQLYGNVSLWAKNKWQIAIHCIGDLANRNALDVYFQVLNEQNLMKTDHRFRIEHSQIVNVTDIPRFGEYGVLPSMQPSHATSDMVFAESRLGKDRLPEAYAWERMIHAGVRALPFGSDFPTVGVVNPFLGLYAAVTRQNLQQQPPGGWLPSQTVSRYRALRGYTLDAAFAAFQENDLGSVEVGKFGDFIVVDKDYFNCQPREIADMKVLRTVIGGKTVFSAKTEQRVEL